MDITSTGSSMNVTSPAETLAADAQMWSTTYRGRNKVIGLVGVVLNVLTLIAVLKHKDLTRFLRCALASLVSTDLGLSATIFLASLLYLPPDYVTLGIVNVLYIFCDCTALTLLVIAMDRACALFRPTWYKNISKHNVKIVLLVLSPWVLAVCFSALSFKGDIRGLPRYPIILLKNSGVLLQAIVLLTCGTGVLLAYVAIGIRLRLRGRRFAVHPSFLSNSATGHMTPSEYQRCRRLTVQTLFLAMWFCIIYIGFSSYLLFIYLTQLDTLVEFNSPRNIFFSSIIMVNSIVNPFLFFWRLVNFTPTLNFIRRLFRRRQQSPQPQTEEMPAQEQGEMLSSNRVEQPIHVCGPPSTYLPGTWRESNDHRCYGPDTATRETEPRLHQTFM